MPNTMNCGDDSMIPVNSIEIPDRFVAIAAEWHSGQDCMLYAVCSTGGLTIGTHCPIYDSSDENDCERKWYLTIWRDLSVDVGRARRAAENGGYDDADILGEFESWVGDVCLRLADSYGLEDWYA